MKVGRRSGITPSMHELYNEGLVTEGFIMEFLHSHSNVIFQPDFDDPRYSGINPYTLGFKMFMDIRRICEDPTDEDREWFPDIAGSDWLETLHFAMHNFKDESFIQQYLSPRVIRELRLFSIMDNEKKAYMEVDAIHDEPGYREIREALAAQYNLGNREPNIQVYNVNVKGDRALTIRHYMHQGRPLGETTEEILRHVHKLWGFDVRLESVDEEDQVKRTVSCPRKSGKDSSNAMIELA